MCAMAGVGVFVVETEDSSLCLHGICSTKCLRKNGGFIMRKNKRWPENCVWPEPVWDGEGVAWEEDDVDPMLLDEDGRELLEIKEYFDTLVEEGRLHRKSLCRRSERTTGTTDLILLRGRMISLIMWACSK